MENFSFKQKIFSEGGAVNFGSAVSIDGELAVVGANTEPQEGIDGAFSYKLNSIWDFTDSFDHAVQNFRFGLSVAVSGNTCVVGTGGNKAFVYVTNDGINWVLEQELIPSGSNAKFGTSVAIDGDTCIVGQPDEFTPATGGSAYVFVRNAGVWAEQDQLIPQTQVDNRFGISVAIENDTCIVGANDYVVGGGIGSAYIFERSGVVWTEQQTLTPSDNGGIDPTGIRFGTTVSLNDGQCIIGAVGAWAPGGLSGDVRTGAVYYFSFNGSTWVEQQKITPPEVQDHGDSSFGFSLSVLGNRCVIGRRFFESTGGSGDDGKAYVYTKQSGSWQLNQSLIPDSVNGQFGSSVSLGSGDGIETLVIGSSTDGDGVVYAYEALLELSSSSTEIFSSGSTSSGSESSRSSMSYSSSSTKILSSQSTDSTSLSSMSSDSSRSTSSDSSRSTSSDSSASLSSESSSGVQQGCIYKNLRKEYRVLIPNKGNKYKWQPSGDITFMMWFRGNNAQYNQHIGGFRRPGFRFYAKSIGGFSYLAASFGNQEIVSPNKLENNTWYHLALIVDGEFMKFYINGELIGPDIFTESSSTDKESSGTSSSR
jgi:hypothetical protein